MKLERLRVRARVELLSSDEGGRRTVLTGPISYRPNHNFYGENDREMCIGAIELADGQSLAPGETLDVEITFLLWPALAREIHEGRRWRLHEGSRLVGWGTVLSVAEPLRS